MKSQLSKIQKFKLNLNNKQQILNKISKKLLRNYRFSLEKEINLSRILRNYKMRFR